MGKFLHTVYDRPTIAFFADLEDLIDVLTVNVNL